MRRTVLLLASAALAGLLACGVLLVGAQERAEAAFPGANGKIVYWGFVGGVHSMNPDGTEEVLLTNGKARCPAVSPDGTKVAFQRNTSTVMDTFMVNLDGTGERNVTNDASYEGCPVWLPGGLRLGYESGGAIYTVKLDGTGERKIPDRPGKQYAPVWSPDGTKIAFCEDEVSPGPNSDSEIYTMNPDGSGVSKLTDNATSECSGGYEAAGNLSWSPDSQKIAYSSASNIEEFNGSTIHTMDRDGSDQTEIVYDKDTAVGNEGFVCCDFNPAWSPDGTKIAFVREELYNSSCCEWDVFSMNLDGSELRRLTVSPDARMDPDWGPATSDTTAPAVDKAPTRDLVPGSAIGNSTAPVNLSWSATDGGSGVARYELQQSTNGGAFAGMALPSETATAINPSLEAGKTYQFQVRAQDNAGNWSAWSSGPAFSVDLRQETHQAIAYAGTWTLQSSPTASEGYLRYATASGARAKFSFAGKHAAWVASTGPNRGKAEVWVDGVKAATVDLYAPTAQPRKMVFVKAWATTPSANHTLEVRALGTKNAASSGKRVDVDAFVALR
jgi:Tol biopolymer transport system component